MLTDLKMSSSASKGIFCRPENNAERVPHETEF